MNMIEHIATTAFEEAVEVGQRVAKALRFGFSEIQPGQPLTNADRIMDEFYQLGACLRLLMRDGMIPDAPLDPGYDAVVANWERIQKFAEIGRAQGVLE